MYHLACQRVNATPFVDLQDPRCYHDLPVLIEDPQNMGKKLKKFLTQAC